ncbi:hypothetical protein BW12_07120 [Bifidobacterium sp. UTCIF-3]|uniref:Ig-like domain-containing protein n=1 Tax=unclassified Bifidobacterium TaxID=2608897 RepID=UPI00112EE442|nr:MULTISPECIES: Ig-like domain-containing protein [unclassified Bifidobacterium]TPF78342.1 hypothetical protein BW09_04625 [Bifidobacterium sp. UTCIF-1]TPF81237.1 hypothetical protein BW08_00955 [Bifidobacterium sp. UTCIF-24]TPF82018.1 hypothetical protein BW12_07120 [Bifidobacterium sp. UTCIF-3]TPF85134.1 hypothetical protein BW07_00230 [Bifidobacterium sp. UTCIF-36]
MSILLNGRKLAKPLRNGVPWNALLDGRKLWGTPADTVTGVEILNEDGTPAPTSLPVNGSIRLAARATYADGHTGEVTTTGVRFTSLDTSVATISGNTVTWRHGGTALVTATMGGFTSAALSVSAAYAPESVTLLDEAGKPVTAVTLRVGEAVNVRANILPAGASQEYTATVKDTGVARVGEPVPTGIRTGVESLTLRVGEAQNITVNVLPDYVSQEFTASIRDTKIASSGQPVPTGVTVTPDSLTLRAGETRSIQVGVQPDYAPQEFTATVKDSSIASVKQQ